MEILSKKKCKHGRVPCESMHKRCAGAVISYASVLLVIDMIAEDLGYFLMQIHVRICVDVCVRALCVQAHKTSIAGQLS